MLVSLRSDRGRARRLPSADDHDDAGDVDDPEVRLAELIMPNHTNHHGTLFGGHALGLMDHAGWVAATRYARRTW